LRASGMFGPLVTCQAHLHWPHWFHIVYTNSIMLPIQPNGKLLLNDQYSMFLYCLIL
jgi:hypothetical protein